MPNGLTKYGNCNKTCFYYSGEGGCFHPDYTKSINECRQCPEDPRTKDVIQQDLKEYKIYLNDKQYVINMKDDLKLLTLTENIRKLTIESITKTLSDAKIRIRLYESKRDE